MTPQTSCPRLVFLGTGGGAHAERCHAAIAFQLAPGRVLLLDTGGGFEVVRQLKRAGIDLGEVTRIFLSHRHSDHLAGLEPLLLHIALQAMRARRTAADVHVYAHPQVLTASQVVIEAMASSAIEFLATAGARVHWLPILPHGAPVEVWPDVRLTAFPADHIPDDGSCLGCAVELVAAERPYRVVYSGDTRSTAALGNYVQGADALIHEVGGVDAQSDAVGRAGHTTAG
ncbi:MAG: MBL fold metallo-hydrolase, partial [Chloroflexota bacterium]|nr:MBL fold metallo-hydrolase [Chloroflexota bacterium]